MKGIRKTSKRVDEEIRTILANNVRWRMQDLFIQESDKPKALAKRAGLYKSRVQNILSKDQGISIDVLASLATALECKPYHLLIPPEHFHRLTSVDFENDTAAFHQLTARKKSCK
jgi:DNA-binding Xre family transcriptional regulator